MTTHNHTHTQHRQPAGTGQDLAKPRIYPFGYLPSRLSEPIAQHPRNQPEESDDLTSHPSAHHDTGQTKTMIEVILNDRLGKKIRVKCNEDDTIGDLKKLVAAQTGRGLI